MLSLEFVRGFDMSSALKKRKINKNLNKKLKLSLRNQLKEDFTKDQISLKEYIDPFTENHKIIL